MKNSKEILEKVAELVGLKFQTAKTEKFAQVELEGGFIITNQSEGDFVVDDTIYLLNEDGTYSVVGAGEWTFLDGEKTFITSEEGKLTEIRSGSDDIMETEEMEEVEVEVSPSVEEVLDGDIVQSIVDALTPVVEQIQQVQEEMMKLKKDYEKFKSEASHEPLKEDKVVSKMFSTDSRYEVLKAMRQSK
jgi:hypothetical protein